MNKPIKRSKICLILTLSFLIIGSYSFAQEGRKNKLEQYQSAKQRSVPKTKDGKKSPNQEELDTIEIGTEQDDEDSYEYHLITYMNSNSKFSQFDHLERLMYLRPDDVSWFGEALEYYGMQEDSASIAQMTDKLNQHGLYQRHLEYYKDMDRLLAADAIVFTNGETDTRPLIMSKSMSNKEYVIIKLNWLHDEEYLHELSTRGIDLPASFSAPSSFIQAVYELNPSRTISLSATLNRELLTKLRTGLTTDGLCFKMSSSSGDDSAIEYYQLLKSQSKTSIGEGLMPALQMNYLPLLAQARKKMRTRGDSAQSELVSIEILQILELNNRLDLLELLSK